MRYPYHEKRDKCSVREEALDLVEVECFGTHCRRLLRQVGDNSFSFIFGQEFDGLGVVWKVKEGIYTTQYGRYTLENEQL